MGTYQIKQTEEGLKIEVKAPTEGQELLLSEFQKCQEGQCSCPTEEYKKLAAMELDVSDEVINIQLVAKDSETIDKEEIARCLEHTTNKVGK